MYFIEWNDRRIRVFLQLNTILKMLEIEGLSFNEVNDIIMSWEPIHFSKVTMTVTGKEKNGKLILRTSDVSDEYLGLRNITMIDIDLKENK